MAKTCVINRNKEGDVESVLVRDPNQIAGDDLINFAIRRNNGYDLDKSPNGKESILYKKYIDDFGLSDIEAKREVAKVYTDNFKNWFGDWQNDPANASKVVDENGMPMIVYHGTKTKFDKFDGMKVKDKNVSFFTPNMNYALGYVVDFKKETISEELFFKLLELSEGGIMPAYLNIRNLKTGLTDVDSNKIKKEIEDDANDGFDGFEGVERITNEISYAITDSNQVALIDDVNNDADTVKYSKSNLLNNKVQNLKNNIGKEYKVLRGILMKSGLVNNVRILSNNQAQEYFEKLGYNFIEAYKQYRNTGGLYNSKTKEIIIIKSNAGDINQTLIHEWGHAFLGVLRESNFELYSAAITVLREARKNDSYIEHEYNSISKDKDYQKQSEKDKYILDEEVLMRILENEYVSKNDKLNGILKQIKQFFKDLLGITSYTPDDVLKMTIGEVSNLILNDMLNSKNPSMLNQNSIKDFKVIEASLASSYSIGDLVEYGGEKYYITSVFPDFIMGAKSEEFNFENIDNNKEELLKNLKEQGYANIFELGDKIYYTESTSQNTMFQNDRNYIEDQDSENILLYSKLSDVVNGTEISMSEDIKRNNFIKSKLYDELKSIPFITNEQALDIYKNIYASNMNYWMDSNNEANVNPNTKEPNIYYKSDSGKIFDSLSDVLKNSSNSYSIGFADNNGVFQSFAESPIYNSKTIKGKVQNLIKNDYLKPIQKGENTYESQDSLAAEMIEEELSLSFPFSFVRNGNNFTIIEDKGEVKPFAKLTKEVGIVDAVRIATYNKYLELKNKQIKPKEVIYDKEQLYTLIENFMKRMGITVTSIENYKKAYSTKFGIEPDAKAFIDIWGKVIAFDKGEITLDGLTEEVSHFIIEAWNQDEIKRILPYVKNTPYYSQFSEIYRNIYSKQISDPTILEEYVQKEILGKMLAESLQKDFNLDGKNEIEKNIFQKLADIVSKFFQILSSKLTKKDANDIEFFTNQVKNLLYNEELDKHLENLNPKSNVQIMYSVPENMERLLNKFGKEFKNTVSDRLEEELAIDGAMSIFKDRLSRASALLKEVEKYSGDENKVIPTDVDLLSKTLLDDRESLEALKVQTLKTAKSTPQTINKINSIKYIADLTLKTISDLSGEIQSIEGKDPILVARELMSEIGIDNNVTTNAIEKSIENLDKNGVKQAQKDMTQLAMLFGHVGKMSNAFVNLMSAIVKKVHNDSIIDTNSDFEKFIEKLIPYRNLINKFYKKGNFVSIVDSEKLRESKLKYEYSIRKKIGDLSLGGISEEEFINDYDNVSKVEKGTPTYYAYDYLYKKHYSNQEWAETDRIDYYNSFIKNVEEISTISELEEGRSPFYAYLKNLSDSRSRYNENDPLRKSENQDIIQDRRDRSNIFNRDGSLKAGLSYMRYSQAKDMLKNNKISIKDVVSTNPKLVPFAENTDLKNNDYVVVLDRDSVELDGQMAFDLLKWNQLNLSKKADLTLLKANFEKEYLNKKKQLEHLNYDEKNKILIDWISDNLQFDMSEEYWNGIDPDNLNIERLLTLVPEKIKQDVNRLETELNSIRLQKNNILKIYKQVGDYKEIDAEKIPADDKLLLENLEIEIYKKKQELQQIFNDYNIDMYKTETDSLVELNQSFYDIFQKTMGVRYENSTITQKKAFFSGEKGMSAEKYSMFLNFDKALGRNQSSRSKMGEMINKYKKLAKDPNDLDSIREAYLKANAPSWYRRYDANTEYGNFVRDLDLGKVDAEELIDTYLKTDSFNYNGKKMDMMQITPSFKYTLAKDKSIGELYEEYQNLQDNREKFNHIMRMGRLDKLLNFEKEDVSWILNDPETLKAYVWVMDSHLNNLKNNDALTSYNIFLRPQQRKGDLERYETFITKGDKKSQIVDSLKERFQYREDDFVDSYKENKIPKYGLYRLNPEELTDDLLGSLIWANKQSNVYKNRIENYSRAMRAISALEQQTFEKGKKSTETNTYKTIKEMLNYNFYGKTTTMRMETNVLGQKIDMAKVLMWFRGFAIKQALGFAPIVALTNVTSGITQNQFLKWTGKNIFSDADDRALKILAPLTSDSIKDIGSFNPTSKLNKLLYSFGIYNIEDRFRNAKFNKTARLLPEAAFGMMAMGNFAMQSRVALSKLMEIRLVDGKFQSWREYYLEEKRKNNTQTDAQIKARFNQHASKSMYDYLDDGGKFLEDKLKQDGYNGDLKKDKSRAMSRIQDIGEQVTMEIRNHNEAQAARDPLWSFALSLKKWLILANTTMFSRKRFDLESGGYEEGLIFSYKHVLDLIKDARKNNIGFAQAYENLEEVEKKNLKTTSIISASMIVLLAIAFMMKKIADDDDEKENYGLQLANYMMLRNLNETFSGNIGVGNSMYEAIQSPIMTANTLGNLTKVMKVSDIGKTVESGKYKGMDKYLTNWIKLTSAKNVYTIKDANSIYETRKGYEFFTSQNALYHIFSMLPKKEDSGN